MLDIPSSFFYFVKNQKADPAQKDQKNWNVAIVDEEACLSSSLESPIHRISTKEVSLIKVLLM